MADLTFLELARLVLKEENRPLSPSEIWKIAEARGYPERLESRGKTPSQTLYSAIFTDERDNPQSSFIQVGARPNRYFLKELAGTKTTNELEKAAATDVVVPEKFAYKEIQLHPFLVRFIRQQFRAYAKTIPHSLSPRKEFGEWVHPDVVAVFYPIQEWNDDVLGLSKATGDIPIKLYSFEIKKQLSFANLREAFFQTVSNSSWAHEGYLAAADISTDEDFRTELRRLCASFGVGVVEIDLEDPNSSSVLFAAREREVLDWDGLNKLSMNTVVQGLLKRIRNDIQTGEIRTEYFDPVLEPMKLAATISRKPV